MNARSSYSTPTATKRAINDAARQAQRENPKLSVDALIRQEYFNRFLSRVFSEGQSSEWLLKGGTAMLARVPATRTTLDIDLLGKMKDLDAALAELLRIAKIDLNDHFRFVFTRSQSITAGEAQEYTDGLRVTFDIYIGPQRQGKLNVDLVVGTMPIGPAEVQSPASGLHMTKLQNYPYRLYPISHQLADKICATMSTYSGLPSTREKDLVDLVVAATSQELRIDAHLLGQAILLESSRRRLATFDRFEVPANWGPRYNSMIRSLPSSIRRPDIHEALELMQLFVDPVLAGNATGFWSPTDLSWG